MNESKADLLKILKQEETNILRSIFGSSVRAHGPLIRGLMEPLNAVQMLIARIEKETTKSVSTKKVNTKSAAPTKAADK